jgi:hypothetical protein
MNAMGSSLNNVPEILVYQFCLNDISLRVMGERQKELLVCMP